jgi:hypothetical protein
LSDESVTAAGASALLEIPRVELPNPSWSKTGRVIDFPTKYMLARAVEGNYSNEAVGLSKELLLFAEPSVATERRGAKG